MMKPQQPLLENDMNTIQQKNIIKTVLIILAVIVAIQVLFLNKMLTPRYLSDIELKINGLVLLKQPKPLSIDQQPEGWLLIAGNHEQKQLLVNFVAGLKTAIQAKTSIMESKKVQELNGNSPYDTQEAIGIIHPNQQLIGYLKPPFNEHKMILTYSSIVAHR